jgi:hypothetical protein
MSDLTPDIALLCAALDAGAVCPTCGGAGRIPGQVVPDWLEAPCPDCRGYGSNIASLLSALADALEEAGDPRGRMLRGTDRRPHDLGERRYRWAWLSLDGTAVNCVLPSSSHVRAPQGWRNCWDVSRNLLQGGTAICFPTRSAAYLALAEAMSREAAHA